MAGTFSVVAGDRTVVRRAACAVKLNGEWFASTAAPLPHPEPVALHWQAGPALATARLIPHEGGVVIECELNNPGEAPLTFNGWRPILIDGGGAALQVGDEPWRASALINGYQSWDYAGIHPLDKALAAAGHAAGARSFPTVPRGWCSWYHLGLAVTESDITRHAAFLAKRMPELARSSANGFRPVIQLDDGWMPRWQRWGDWVANE